MTTFTGPLHVKTFDTDTTVMSVESTGGVAIVGAITATSAVSITGPVSAGTTGAQGRMSVTQAVTLAGNSSGASNIRIPANSQITDVWMLVTATASGNTQGLIVRIGTSTDATFFGSLKGSARNIYRAPNVPNATGASVAAYRIGASNVQIHLDVTAATTAAGETDLFEAILCVEYVR